MRDTLHLSLAMEVDPRFLRLRGARVALTLAYESLSDESRPSARYPLDLDPLRTLADQAKAHPTHQILQPTSADEQESKHLQSRMEDLQQMGLTALGGARSYLPEGLEQIKIAFAELMRADHERISRRLNELAMAWSIPVQLDKSTLGQLPPAFVASLPPEVRDGQVTAHLCPGIRWFDGRGREHAAWMTLGDRRTMQAADTHRFVSLHFHARSSVARYGAGSPPIHRSEPQTRRLRSDERGH